MAYHNTEQPQPPYEPEYVHSNQSMSMAYHNTEQPQPPYEPEYVHGISQY